MTQRILILQGHPDRAGGHLCDALAQRCAQGAASAGHEPRTADVATLGFPLLRSQREWQGEWQRAALPTGLVEARQAIGWATHLVLFLPLWRGNMPALLKGFLEQVARPGFMIAKTGEIGRSHQLLTGRSARVVLTMGMPALVYRWYFRAHSVKSLERNILGFCGIAPIDETLIGLVDGLDQAARLRWFVKLHALVVKAA